MTNILLLTTRVATLIPLSFLLYKQVVNLVLRPATNGLAKTRKTLTILTAAIWIDLMFFTVFDFHAYVLGVDRALWLQQVQLAILFIRVIMMIAIWRFYRLLYRD